MGRRGLKLMALLALTGATVGVVAEAAGAQTDTETGTVVVDHPSGIGAMVPGDARLMDTRSGGTTVDGVDQALGRLAAGSTVQLAIDGRSGFRPDASAVVLNIVIVAPSSDGFAVGYVCDNGRPKTSTINYVAGQTISNTLILPGDAGALCIYTLGETDLVIDYQGQINSDAGYVHGSEERIVDTRLGLGGERVAAKKKYDIDALDGRGITLLNVVATGASDAGYLTFDSCDDIFPAYLEGTSDPFRRPGTSNLNFEHGATVANLVVLNTWRGGNGTCLFSSADVDLVIDVVGTIGQYAGDEFTTETG